MALLVLAFIAGVLTVAAPCILPLLPVIVGGTIVRGGVRETHPWRPLAIVGGLAGSVIIFTLLLKASTALLGVPQMVWQTISGVIVLLFGLTLLAPGPWAQLMARSGLDARAHTLMNGAHGRSGYWGDVLLGAALGPVFSSCSPTYALIVASVLPASFGLGLAYLVAYAIGLGGTLLVIAYVGRAATQRLGWLANPSGALHKIIGLLFVLVGIMVLTGFDKTVQTYVLDQGWYDPIIKLEQRLELGH